MLGGGGPRRAVGAVAIVLSVLAVPRVALAGDDSDTVVLKSGGLVRGVVMEYDPAGQARVKLADGSIRTIDSSLIARVSMGAERPPPAPSAPQTPQGPVGRLHVEGPAELEIMGRPNDGYEWAPICQAPCDRPVHLDWEYSARGAGVRASAPFQLSAADGQHVSIAVDPASSTWFVLGIVGVVGGASVTVVGLYVMLIGSVVQSVANDASSQMVSSQSGSIVATGGVITAVGAALLIGGGIATISNWSTHVNQVQSKDALPAPRLPTWHLAEMRGAAPVTGAAFESPILTVRF